jgi:hypothetical protein
MNDTYKPPINDTNAAGGNNEPPVPNDAGKALLVGVIGGIASAIGYVIYSRLPDEQKDRLHHQVRGVVESRISDIRSNLNI